jgi:hypothetical protein
MKVTERYFGVFVRKTHLKIIAICLQSNPPAYTTHNRIWSLWAVLNEEEYYFTLT